MIAKNEKSKSQGERVRTEERTIQFGINTRRGGGAGRTSSEVGDESLSIRGVNRAGATIFNTSGQCNSGEVVDRLISKTIVLIQQTESTTADLRLYLAELRDLRAQVEDAKEDTK